MYAFFVILQCPVDDENNWEFVLKTSLLPWSSHIHWVAIGRVSMDSATYTSFQLKCSDLNLESSSQSHVETKAANNSKITLSSSLFPKCPLSPGRSKYMVKLSQYICAFWAIASLTHPLLSLMGWLRWFWETERTQGNFREMKEKLNSIVDCFFLKSVQDMESSWSIHYLTPRLSTPKQQPSLKWQLWLQEN